MCIGVSLKKWQFCISEPFTQGIIMKKVSETQITSTFGLTHFCMLFCNADVSRSQSSSSTDGDFLYVARLTPTRAIPQAIVPGTAAPSPKGVPAIFHETQTTKPASIPAIMP